MVVVLQVAERAPHFLLLAVEVIQGARHRDPVQPGRELRLAPVALQPLVRREEDFLHDVFGVLVVAQHPPDHGPDAGEVTLDEEVEGLAIAARRPFNQAGIAALRGGLRVRDAQLLTRVDLRSSAHPPQPATRSCHRAHPKSAPDLRQPGPPGSSPGPAESCDAVLMQDTGGLLQSSARRPIPLSEPTRVLEKFTASLSMSPRLSRVAPRTESAVEPMNAAASTIPMKRPSRKPAATATPHTTAEAATPAQVPSQDTPPLV